MSMDYTIWISKLGGKNHLKIMAYIKSTGTVFRQLMAKITRNSLYDSDKWPHVTATEMNLYTSQTFRSYYKI